MINGLFPISYFHSLTFNWKQTKQFAVALNDLDVTDDSNDLDLRIKQFFDGRTFQSKSRGGDHQFFIAPYIESHLKLKLYFPNKLVWKWKTYSFSKKAFVRLSKKVVYWYPYSDFSLSIGPINSKLKFKNTRFEY